MDEETKRHQAEVEAGIKAALTSLLEKFAVQCERAADIGEGHVEGLRTAAQNLLATPGVPLRDLALANMDVANFLEEWHTACLVAAKKAVDMAATLSGSEGDAS